MRGYTIVKSLQHQHTSRFALWARGERNHDLVFFCSFQKEETSLTKDRNHLEDREIWGWGFSFESWQLNAVVLPDQKRGLGANFESRITTQRHQEPPEI